MGLCAYLSAAAALFFFRIQFRCRDAEEMPSFKREPVCLLRELNEYKEEVAAEITKLKEALEERIVQDVQKTSTDANSSLHKVREELLEYTEKIDGAVRSTFAEELQSCERRLRDALEAAQERSLAETGRVLEAATAATAEIRSFFEEELQRIRAEASESHLARQQELQEAREYLQKTIHKHSEASAEEDQRLEKRVDETRAELQALREQSKKDTKKASADLAMLRVFAETETKGLHEQVAAEVAKVKALSAKADELKSFMITASNVSTKWFEWRLQEAVDQLAPPEWPEETRSWFSPLFDAGGARGLRLEFRLYRRPKAVNGYVAIDGKVMEDRQVEDCGLFLWSSAPCHLVFRLHVGEHSRHMEGHFDGSLPVGTNRLCSWRYQVLQEDGSLFLACEVLKCTVRLDGSADTLPVDPQGKHEEDGRLKLPAKVGLCRQSRFNIVEQVKHQVQHMRACMVRRVEWRLQRASALQAHFPKGAELRSISFAAAGLENLQLVFYPSGSHEARDGLSSLYVKARAGTCLEGYLQVGEERKDIRHCFDQDGFFGRCNFVRLCDATDSSDSILLALDIDESYFDVQARMRHLPGASFEGLDSVIDASEPIDSIVKLRRIQGVPASLSTVKCLPAGWKPPPAKEQESEELGRFQKETCMPENKQDRTDPACRAALQSPRGALAALSSAASPGRPLPVADLAAEQAIFPTASQARDGALAQQARPRSATRPTSAVLGSRISRPATSELALLQDKKAHLPKVADVVAKQNRARRALTDPLHGDLEHVAAVRISASPPSDNSPKPSLAAREHRQRQQEEAPYGRASTSPAIGRRSRSSSHM
eukprot:TRINITY_DN102430_c0_g1_i1.p1 TRINITY_DN102430_c0_g1~~TRINITY_DN102430_c0_g1_i1.p1  ORF type:complete len:831 (-),score=159.96 TRINITY_DN102430_c0_g1_i1:264-2756(-)